MSTTDQNTESVPADLRDIITYNGKLHLYRPIVSPKYTLAHGDERDAVMARISDMSCLSGRYQSSSDALDAARIELEARGVDIDTVDIRVRTVVFFGADDPEKMVTPWTIVEHLCTCVPGTLKVVQQFMGDFAEWTDSYESEIKNSENARSAEELIDEMSQEENWDDAIAAINRALSGIEEANETASEYEDSDIENDLSRAEEYLNSALSGISNRT